MNRWISLALSLFLLPAHVFSAGGYSTSIGDSDILITGQKTISYRYAFAFGNKDIFRGDNMVSLGGTINEQSTFLTINGNVPGKFSIIGTLSDGTYMGSQASIEIKAKNLSLYLGDIAANLPGGEFGSFNKNLNGIKVEGDWGKSKFTLITSQLESQSKTETFQGNGTMGPYRLEYGWQLIEGSETVRVDGKIQMRNQDYRIENGSLYFTNKFLYSHNTIQVTYEYSLDFNLNPGTLSGFRGTTQLWNNKITLGTTVFRQTTNKYTTGAIFRGIDTFAKIPENRAFQVKYWPIVDNSDSEVLILVYTEDPTYPEKTWSSQYNKYTGEPANVRVKPELGQVEIINLQDIDPEKVSRVEVEYYYQISFGDSLPIVLAGEEPNPSVEGEYILIELPKLPDQLVQRKAHLHYEIDGKGYDLTLYPQHFAEDSWLANNKLRIKKEAFAGKPPLDNLKALDVTLFSTLPPARDAEDSYRAHTTVVTLDARAQLTPRISLQGELGFSSGNRSADELYITETLTFPLIGVGLADADENSITLYLSRFDGTGTVYFPLPIEPMSETITLRTTTGTTTLMRGDSYEIDFDTGVIKFYGAAAETLKSLLIDESAAQVFDSLAIKYKYLDKKTLESEGEEVTGLGVKIGGTANFDKVSLNLNWRSLGREFNPLGMTRSTGYGSKELSRLTAGVTLRPTSFLQIGTNINSYANVNVIKEGDQIKDIPYKSDQISNEVRLSVPGWPTLTLNNSRSLAPSSERVENTVSTNYNWKIFNFSASLGTSDYDYTVSGVDYSQTTLRRNFNVTARPNSKFNTGYSFTNSVQLGTQQTTSNTNNAHNLTMEYRPSNRLTVGGSYNVQLLDPTSGERRNIQKGSLNFTHNLSQKVTLRGSLSRTMDPGSYYGGSTVDYGNFSWNYNFSSNLSFSSSLYLSNSTYGNGSYSRYGTIQGDVRYTPQHNLLRQKGVQITWSNSYRPSASYWTSSSSAPTESHTATSSLNVSFRPLPGLSLRTGYEFQFNKSTSTTTVGTSPFTNTLTANATYTISYKIQATGNIRLSDNARSWSSSYYGTGGSGYGRKLEGTVGINYTISPSARVNVDWQLIGFQDGKKVPGASYFGNVITTKLIGTF